MVVDQKIRGKLGASKLTSPAWGMADPAGAADTGCMKIKAPKHITSSSSLHFVEKCIVTHEPPGIQPVTTRNRLVDDQERQVTAGKTADSMERHRNVGVDGLAAHPHSFCEEAPHP